MLPIDTKKSRKTDVLIVSLRDPSFISLLRSFKNMLKTSIGPDGSYKLLVSGGGYVQLSASSSHIVQHYDQLDSPIIQYIVQIMKTQCDYGLYSGLIISSSLEHLLSLQSAQKISSKECITFFNFLVENFDKLFDSDTLKNFIGLDSLSNFILLVRTVLMSKPVFVGNDFLPDLCLYIVRAFIYSLNEEKSSLGKVIIQIFKGRDECKVCPGILYQLTDDDDWIFDVVEKSYKGNCKYKTLLFTTPLDNETNENSNLVETDYSLKKIFELLDIALMSGVNLIACQKVIHCNVVLYLRRKSIIVLERMGTDLANQFEQITGSFPISSISRVSNNDLSSMMGTIDDVHILNFGEKMYLTMERESAGLVTLLLKTSCLAGTQQTQILVEQALNVLRGLVRSPFACPGAGCFEICLFLRIQELCLKKGFKYNFKWFLNVLLESSGCSLPVWTDTVYNHTWTKEDQLKCNCKMISSDMLRSSNGTLVFISLDNELIDISSNDFTNSLRKIELTDDAIVDSFVLKRNSILVSFETCLNLLNIGTVVYKNRH